MAEAMSASDSLFERYSHLIHECLPRFAVMEGWVDMRLRRITAIALVASFVSLACLLPCSAQEYAGWVLDSQALQGIKRILVAWNKGNMAYNAAKRAVGYFEEQDLQTVKVALWDGEPFDFGTFDALLVIEAFSLEDRKTSSELYTKAPSWKQSWSYGDEYKLAQVTAEVKATWVTVYLIRVESGALSLGSSSVPRKLTAIAYVNSDGGGEFFLDDPSSMFSSRLYNPMMSTSFVAATRKLVQSFVNDMKIIDPQTWMKRAEDQQQGPESRPIAIVNDQPITWQEFISRMKDTGNEGYSVLDQTIDANGQIVLDQMIAESLIRQAAKKAGIKVSSYEIDAELSMIRDQLGTSYGEVLAQYGMTENALRTNIEMNFLAVKYSTKDLVITDEDLRRYFEENKDLYTSPEIVRVSHILVDTEEEAKQIAQQLKDGADFATLATEKSTDTMSAANGGDLDWFSRGQMVEPFEKVAFSMRPGQISEPVKTDYGYHIIKMTDRKPAYEAVFDEVRYDVERDFRTSKASSFAELAASLRAEGEITITCKTSMH